MVYKFTPRSDGLQVYTKEWWFTSLHLGVMVYKFTPRSDGLHLGVMVYKFTPRSDGLQVYT